MEAPLDVSNVNGTSNHRAEQESSTDTSHEDATSIERVPGEEPVPPELQDVSGRDTRYVLDLFDALTHCAEPPGSHAIIHHLESKVAAEDGRSKAPAQSTDKHPWDNITVMDTSSETLDFDQGRYQMSTNEEGQRVPRPSWPSEFKLVRGVAKIGNNSEKEEPYFQVFRSVDEFRRDVWFEKKSRDFAVPELVTGPEDRLVYKFGHKYCDGPSAYDDAGDLIWIPFFQPSSYEYAEHAFLGDNLHLKWSATKTLKGVEKLNMSNGNKLSYGQINGLGGDFFATMTPICMGSSFEEQCTLFEKAFATLAIDKNVAVKEATAIIQNREDEINALNKVDERGFSTPDDYNKLKKPGKSSLGYLDQADEDLTRITWDREGPSYLRIAQLNLDHFGADARTAYNAGHTCALRTAAAGNLELAYAMNAFADHFLEDSFASGHVRTPRRALHGTSNDVQKAIDFVMEVVRGTKSLADTPLSTINSATEAVAPDLCSKFMHDEDNSLGLWVRNPRKEQWQAFGDKKLLAKENRTNVTLLKEALQISVDEVYTAYESRNAPAGTDGYGVWQIAPSELAPANLKLNHQPLFNADGHYRKNFDDLNCTKYNDPNAWFKWPPWEGYRLLACNMSKSEHFKKL